MLTKQAGALLLGCAMTCAASQHSFESGFAEQVIVRRYNRQGHEQQHFALAKVQRVDLSQRTQLSYPQFSLVKGNNRWWLTAKQGQVSTTADEVYLSGHVRLENSSPTANKMLMTTHALRYYPKTQVAKTLGRVYLRQLRQQGTLLLTAGQGTFYGDNNRLDFHHGVILRQQQHTIQAERFVLLFNDNHQCTLAKAVAAPGKWVQFTTRVQGRLVTAVAKRLDYRVSEGRLQLLNQVQIRHSGQTLRAHTASYDIGKASFAIPKSAQSRLVLDMESPQSLPKWAL